jgi:guanylate kinase
MVAANGFVEWAHVHNFRYGTSKRAIEERMAQGADVILEIDYQGAIADQKHFCQRHFHFHPAPSWEELRSRLERRGEDAPKSLMCA